MNLTISVEDALLKRAREAARKRGISLQEFLRAQLLLLVGERSGAEVATELVELMRTSGGHSGGRAVKREDAYEQRC